MPSYPGTYGFLRVSGIASKALSRPVSRHPSESGANLGANGMPLRAVTATRDLALQCRPIRITKRTSRRSPIGSEARRNAVALDWPGNRYPKDGQKSVFPPGAPRPGYIPAVPKKRNNRPLVPNRWIILCFQSVVSPLTPSGLSPSRASAPAGEAPAL